MGAEQPQVLVLGATGVLGKRILALARERLAGVTVLGGCRRPPEEAPGFVAVDLHDEESLAAALEGISVVVNAVGPFSYAPEPLVEACVAAGADLVDIADDVGYLARVRVEAVAQDTIRIVPGCSTIPALVECLAQRWRGEERVERLAVRLAMGTRNQVSRALLFSLMRPLGRAQLGGQGALRERRWHDLSGGEGRLYGNYPSPFDAHGVRVGARELPAELAIACDRALYLRALALARPLLGLLSDPWLMRVSRVAMPFVSTMRWLGSPVGALTIEAVVEKDRVLESLEVRAERDGLSVPALPAVWAAARLLRSRGQGGGGHVTLAALLSPQEATAELEAAGYLVTLVRRSVK